MTLMCIDRSQSPATHKGGSLQGRKSPAGGGGKQRRHSSCSPPPGGAKPAQSPGSSRYKTELCRPYEESGACKYGDKCQFAHGARELRSLARHPKYKTELCRTFHSTGLCPYGPRCHFIHNAEPGAPPLGSTGDASPASSAGGTPTGMRSFDDLYLDLGVFADPGSPLDSADPPLAPLFRLPVFDLFHK